MIGGSSSKRKKKSRQRDAIEKYDEVNDKWILCDPLPHPCYRWRLRSIRPQRPIAYITVYIAYNLQNGNYIQQVTRGHNIVADRLAGAANHHPHLTSYQTPFPSQTHTQTALKRSFFYFLTHAHGPTDQQTNRQSLI